MKQRAYWIIEILTSEGWQENMFFCSPVGAMENFTLQKKKLGEAVRLKKETISINTEIIV